uniref:F-box domain-containing protein n=1 Tax=Globodera rostochiensis TaxID=31243 RepID=A0A914HFB1_GLORO
MSDNSEQQQQMQEISICADVWLKVFAFLSPLELGLKMALINDRFDALVDMHFKSRKWSLSWLHIHRAIDGHGAQIVNLSGDQLPIPQGPLPGQVIGFEGIRISYVDQIVIEFLERIRRLFDSAETNVYITTSDNQNRSWEIILEKIWPLVNDNICGFLLVASPQLAHLRQFSPTILRDCAKLRSIVASCQLFPEFPAEDNAGASSRQAVTKWLLTSRGDGLPKMITFIFIPQGISALKEAFVNAPEPTNFILNNMRERLTLRHLNGDNWLLVRCPIGREEDKWAKWEEEAIGWEWRRQWNRISIELEDSDIGDKTGDAKAGPEPTDRG